MEYPVKLFCVVAALALLASNPATAGNGSDSRLATPQIDAQGMLVGATGVLVNGKRYDVTFQSATCNAQFDGCSRFDFGTMEEALAAAHALLEQVFVGKYDLEPMLTRGCTEASVCIFAIPYSTTDTRVVRSVSCWNRAVAGYSNGDEPDGARDSVIPVRGAMRPLPLPKFTPRP